MASKIVKKFDEFSLVFNANDQYVSFGICGPIDNVRLAAREAIFGLHIPQGNDYLEVTNFEHTSELDKMRYGESSVFDEEHAQITIRIKTEKYAQLIVMFRYCEQIGIPVSNNDLSYFKSGEQSFTYKLGDDVGRKGTLPSYLKDLKRYAARNDTPIEVPEYPRPDNRCFWLKSELKAEEEQQFKMQQKANEQFSLFSKTANRLEVQKMRINLRIDNIVSLISIMLQNHPENPNQVSRGIALSYLYNYRDIKAQDPQYDIFDDNFHDFSLVRQDERKKFLLLADKFIRLDNEYNLLNKASQLDCHAEVIAQKGCF